MILGRAAPEPQLHGGIRVIRPIRSLVVASLACLVASITVGGNTANAHVARSGVRASTRSDAGTVGATESRSGRHHLAHPCRTRACITFHHRPRLGQHYTVSSTCYAQGGASGQDAYFGEVANNFLPLGTRIRLDQAAFGRRDFVIEDHIGWGSELDIFYPSESACNQYGRQSRGFWTLR